MTKRHSLAVLFARLSKTVDQQSILKATEDLDSRLRIPNIGGKSGSGGGGGIRTHGGDEPRRFSRPLP